MVFEWFHHDVTKTFFIYLFFLNFFIFIAYKDYSNEFGTFG